MSKIKNTEINTFSRILLVFIAATFFLTCLLSNIRVMVTYAADSHEYTLRYPADDATKQKMQNEITSTGIGNGGGGLEKSDILAKGNKFNGIKFNFNRGLSNDYDMLIYTKDVYCTLKETKVTTTPPSSDELYVRYKMAVGIYPGGTGGTLFNQNDYQTWAGPADNGEHYLHLPAYNPPIGSSEDPVGGSNHDTVIKNGHGKKVYGDNTEAINFEHQIKETGVGGIDTPGNFDPSTGQMIALDKYWPGLIDGSINRDKVRDALNPLITKCLPSNKDGRLTSNYAKLSDADKNSWTAEVEAAGDPGAGPDSSTAPPGSNPDCDVTNNPLTWIICPIIDLGANFTDAIFTTFVRPLLEDIPIDTAPDDAGYRAWQSFRALANIMLVGCLLAIVYAQARGDK